MFIYVCYTKVLNSAILCCIMNLLEMPKFRRCLPNSNLALLEIKNLGGSKMTKYEKFSLAISLALLILSLLSYLKM